MHFHTSDDSGKITTRFILSCMCIKIKNTNMSILEIILAILLPPLAVGLKKGIGTTFFLNVLLTIIGWLPGVIHAFYVLSKKPSI